MPVMCGKSGGWELLLPTKGRALVQSFCPLLKTTFSQCVVDSSSLKQAAYLLQQWLGRFMPLEAIDSVAQSQTIMRMGMTRLSLQRRCNITWKIAKVLVVLV